MDYKVVVASSRDSEDEAKFMLERKVTSLIFQGWKPIGGVSVSGYVIGYTQHYIMPQAMIKE